METFPASPNAGIWKGNRTCLYNLLALNMEVKLNFMVKLYEKEIIDMKTKNAVKEKSGMDGADTLLDRLEFKVGVSPQHLDIILNIMEEIEDMRDIARRIRTDKHKDEEEMGTCKVVGKGKESLKRKRPHVEKVVGKGKDSRKRKRLCVESEYETDKKPQVELAASGLRNTPVGKQVQSHDILNAARALKDEFDDMMTFTAKEVRSADANELRFRITCFVKSERVFNESIEGHLSKIEDFVAPSAVLNYLYRYDFIGYINYTLIKVVQKVIKSKLLDKHVEEYEKDYQLFLRFTLKDIHNAFRKCPDLQPNYPVGLPKFTIHLESEWDGRSMYEWKEVLERRWSDWPETLNIEKISENCIIITYGVWPKFADVVVKDLTDPIVVADLKKEGVTIDVSPQLLAFMPSVSMAAIGLEEAILEEPLSTTQLFAIEDVEDLTGPSVTAVSNDDELMELLSETQVSIPSTTKQPTNLVTEVVEDLTWQEGMLLLKPDWDKQTISSGFDEECPLFELQDDVTLSEAISTYEQVMRKILREKSYVENQLQMEKEMRKKTLVELEQMRELILMKQQLSSHEDSSASKLQTMLAEKEKEIATLRKEVESIQKVHTSQPPAPVIPPGTTAPIQPTKIWSGTLETIENRGNQKQAIPVLCNILVSKPETAQEIKPELWSNKLSMSIHSINLLNAFTMFFRANHSSLRTVHFQFMESAQNVMMLRALMNNDHPQNKKVGIIHLNGASAQCPIKAFFIIYQEKGSNKQFTGLIPLEQEKFIATLKQAMAQRQLQQPLSPSATTQRVRVPTAASIPQPLPLMGGALPTSVQGPATSDPVIPGSHDRQISFAHSTHTMNVTSAGFVGQQSSSSVGQDQPAKKPERNQKRARVQEKDKDDDTSPANTVTKKVRREVDLPSSSTGHPKKKVKTKKSSFVKEQHPSVQGVPAAMPTPDFTTEPMDPNEPNYCLCNQVEFGEMIGCDNDDCPIEWFHFPCVELTAKPKGKWYCPLCLPERSKRQTSKT